MEGDKNQNRLSFVYMVLVFAIIAVIFSIAWKSKPPEESTASVAEAITLAVVNKEPQIETQSKDGVSILFVGDMNFDRYIRQISERKGQDHIFSCIKPLFAEADFVVGNLEGPITGNRSESVGSAIGSPQNYRFTFATSTAEVLFRNNIKVVNIGNNHIRDFGFEGFESTKGYLKNAGVSYFGGVAGDSEVHRMAFDNFNISFVGYNQFGGDSLEKVVEVVANEHEAGNKVIVYTHWGEEYTVPTNNMKSAAALFAEAGADIVIGSHPHVVQSHEVIANTIVYYSLGNFIFDQYFDESVKNGLALVVNISEAGITVEEKPVIIQNNGTTCEKKI